MNDKISILNLTHHKHRYLDSATYYTYPSLFIGISRENVFSREQGFLPVFLPSNTPFVQLLNVFGDYFANYDIVYSIRLDKWEEKEPTAFSVIANIRSHEVGDYASSTFRFVHEILHSGNSKSYRVGITLHPEAGTWSSYPEHKAESGVLFSMARNPFVERKAFFTYPPRGWALQVRRGFNENNEFENYVKVINDGDVVDVPCGFHPVVSQPEYNLGYIWAYRTFSNTEKFVGDIRV